MKCGARVALGVAGGYFLGRTKKMKLALMLGGMAAGRRVGGPGELLGQGTKLLRQSPELSALTDQVRGRLLDAGKDAAMAVAARQVESLTDRVGKRVESLGNVGAGRDTKAREEPEGDETDEVPEDEAHTAEREPAAEDGTNDAADEADPPPRQTRRRATSNSARSTAKSGSTGGSSSAAPKRRSTSTTASGSSRTSGSAAGKAPRSGARKAASTTGATDKSRRPARTRRSGTDD